MNLCSVLFLYADITAAFKKSLLKFSPHQFSTEIHPDYLSALTLQGMLFLYPVFSL